MIRLATILILGLCSQAKATDMTQQNFAISGGSFTVTNGITATSLNVVQSTVTSKAYFGVVNSTQAVGAAGALVTVSCPSGKFALSGGCICTSTEVGVVTIITNAPFPTPTINGGGAIPTGWQCQSGAATTGQTCAAYALCSVIQN